MKEIWKDIKNYEGKYQVSNFGRIKKLPFITYSPNSPKRKYYYNKERIIKQRLDKRSNRYYTVELVYQIDNKKYCRCAYVHTLVAETFLGDRPDNYVIDHINRNTFDNNINNLRYVTQSDNCKNTDGVKYKYLSEKFKGRTGINKNKKATNKWRDNNGKIHWKFN